MSEVEQRFARLKELGDVIRRLPESKHELEPWPDDMVELAEEAIRNNPENPTDEQIQEWAQRLAEKASEFDDC